MTRALPWLLILLAVLQPLTGAFAALTGLGTPIGEASRNINAPEQPLPAFFSIWGVIFLAYGAFGVAGFLRPADWYARVGQPLLIAGAFNIVWMLSAQLIALQPLDYAMLFPILIASWRAAAVLNDIPPSEPKVTWRLADLASGLLSGWIVAAVSVSTPLTLRSLTTLGPTDFPWPMFWTAIAFAGLAAWVFAVRISRTPWFFVALSWGLVGIALNNWLRTGMHWIAFMAAVATATILLLRVTRGAKRSKPGA